MGERGGGERRVQWHKHGHSICDNPVYMYLPMAPDKAPTVYSKVTHDRAQNSLWTPRIYPPDRRQCVG